MNKNRKTAYAAVGVLIAVILIMIFFIVRMHAKVSQDSDSTAAVSAADESPIPFVTEKVTISGEEIASGIRNMGELVTADYYYTHAENLKKAASICGIELGFTASTLVYTVDGNIKAGIDFTAVTVDVDDESKTVQIHIPDSEIVSSEIDHDTFEIVDEKDGFLTDLTAEDLNKTFAHAKEQEEEKAVQNGLLDRADENAADLLTTFVKNSFDLNDYTIEVGK